MKWGAVFGSVALAAFASLQASMPAQAADMTLARPAPPSTYIPTPFYWTGFYLGAGGGFGFGSAPFTDPFTGVAASPSIKGGLLTGLSGINYQLNSFVLGVEGDFTGAWVKGSVLDGSGNDLQASMFWTASFTGRAGVAFDRVLVFFKGGAALAYDRDTVTVANGSSALGSTYRGGWTIGGGVEYAFTDHWTVRGEYDYLKFASKGFLFSANPLPSPLAPLPSLSANGNVGFNLNELKAIVAYKF